MDVSQICLGFSTPQLAGRKISQKCNYFTAGVDYNPDGVDYMTRDWDNLLLLDACRYDAFEQVYGESARLRKIESRGSSTPEFLRGNFRGRTFHDTVYVTTNPMLYRHRDEINVGFHEVVNLWSGDSWDDTLGTVLPEVVTEEVLTLADSYPNKRLFIHYMQPHYPFIDSQLGFDRGHISSSSPSELTTWMQVQTGQVDVDRETIWEAYLGNLRLVLPHAEELADTISGKTVVTSDHGNMFGERAFPIPYREWGHPPGIWTDELVSVPWLEFPVHTQKEVTSDSPITRTKEENLSVQHRLESLGYV